MEEILTHGRLGAHVPGMGEGKSELGFDADEGHAAAVASFRRAGSFAKEQMQALRSLHDSFARALSNSLGACLRGAPEIGVVGVEQIGYPEVLQRMPVPNFACSISLNPLGALAVAELDLSLAVPIIDMLLGGTGGPASEVRDVTDIEEDILASVIQLICTQLEATWRPLLNLDVRFIRREKPGQLHRLFSPKEKMIAVAVGIRAGDAQGTLRMVFPALIASALLRKIEEQDQPPVREAEHSENDHLRMALEKCPFHAELLLPEAAIPAARLMHLKTGEVLEFPLKANVPILFKIENQVLFHAHPVAAGERRAAEIHANVVPTQPNPEERQ